MERFDSSYLPLCTWKKLSNATKYIDDDCLDCDGRNLNCVKYRSLPKVKRILEVLYHDKMSEM